MYNVIHRPRSPVPGLGNGQVPARGVVHGSDQAWEVRGQRMTVNRTSAHGARSYNRSSITNGNRLLPGVHSQSQWARRFRDIISLLASDQGGDDNLSEARRSLIRRCACLQVELELLEVRFALAGGADVEGLDTYQRTANSLRRLLEGIGIDRRAKDVTSLGEVLRAGMRS